MLGAPDKSIEIPILTILREKTQISRTNIDIRRHAYIYGHATSVSSLVGCRASPVTRRRNAEGTGCLVLTESEKPAPWEDRYSGRGTNGAYDCVFCTRSTGRRCPMLHRGVMVVF